ncbi:hypothetical protein SNK03_002726 [Fusarium graminearum]|uniref:Chromosome 1, complete genome n=2 Tax=Gibberella zeae TaxID=5518 RepID=I1RFA4_GIBZE|nr:hypothetical protein FGSG_02373 [Fusarium graminearum PH-1]EYB31033.1 hypothetical protein FG05_02373 [Fusarium graminearum]ESU07799.1 hypothetical protein FGSG_02373 [Fusarium graminearum PH-1]KAI6749907.1 hypothetical protein HG531_007172 [Fusarium graminearum]PCD39384.1 hypothetical protein FGRA07_00655 [Fusarium graminearum]CAF3451110.1 unnamed protein product [Fusarium graminearum]|eukprot:XP_011318284.1 hypothetical protein FGSG_02373 [Fusarium graminearum PH-1]
MDENQITGSVQYAFGPDGVLVTGPVLMDDPATGKIICACCRVPKSEHSFLTMGPYNFKSQFCLDCERPRLEQPPPSTLGKRGLDTESEPEHTVSKPEVAKKSKGTETDEKIESSGS